MSATFDCSLFASYFVPRDPPSEIFVGVHRYEVSLFYIDGLQNCLPLSKDAHQHTLPSFVEDYELSNLGSLVKPLSGILWPSFQHIHVCLP